MIKLSYQDLLMELKKNTGFQVYESRTTKNDVSLPYIVCTMLPFVETMADNSVYFMMYQVNIMLFTYQGDEEGISTMRYNAEKKVEDFISGYNSTYEKETEWNAESELYITTYTVTGFN